VPEAYEQVYAVVRRIPKGKVLTYGLVSHLVNERLSAQGVGWALQALASVKTRSPNPAARAKGNARSKETKKAKPVPWHRVVNSQGGISTHKNPNIPPGLQQSLLEKEGIEFNEEEKMDLPKYLWKKGLASKLIQQ
jgi:methylated-DNA-protein-cysteine methyltransferase related protein